MKWLVFICICLPVMVSAGQNQYHLSTPAKQQRFQMLTHELRCLVCQNEDLYESNAPLAADLRALIAKKIEAGESNAKIKSFLVARYGEFVLYEPRYSIQNSILWSAPIFLFLLISFYIFRWIRRS